MDTSAITLQIVGIGFFGWLATLHEHTFYRLTVLAIYFVFLILSISATIKRLRRRSRILILTGRIIDEQIKAHQADEERLQDTQERHAGQRY